MPDTLVHDAEMPVTFEDALDWLGSLRPQYFVYRDDMRLRIGQSWVNCLGKEDRDKLIGTLADPFYRDDYLSVIQALMFLLEN